MCVLQIRQKDEIEQIRKAGHDSLAMIVEQYKVGTQVVVQRGLNSQRFKEGEWYKGLSHGFDCFSELHNIIQ